MKKANLIEGAKAPWVYILRRLEKQKFLNMDYPRLVNLWSKIKMSAKIHSKNGDDIDVEVWTLLQAHKDIVDGKTKPNTEKEPIDEGCGPSGQEKPVAPAEEQPESGPSKNVDNQERDNYVSSDANNDDDGSDQDDGGDDDYNPKQEGDDGESEDDDEFEEKFEATVPVKTERYVVFCFKVCFSIAE